MQDVKAFTEEIGRKGSWNDEPLEGFVVRTTTTTTKDATQRPPYAAGSSFFIKVKFDEPYMMYRDWREITKALLVHGGGAKLPKSRIARPETKLYVKWVRNEIKKHPELFDGYVKGHGVIATRERFLRWKETGAEIADGVAAVSHKRFGKTIIMPIAVPGAGTSCMSVYLALLKSSTSRQNDYFRCSCRAVPIRAHAER